MCHGGVRFVVALRLDDAGVEMLVDLEMRVCVLVHVYTCISLLEVDVHAWARACACRPFDMIG
jgi:hypothetical protein